MKKFLLIVLTVLLVFALFACGEAKQQDAVNDGPDDSGRVKAEVFDFDISGKEEIVVENQIFDSDVTVKGENGKVTFLNCVFNGNISNNGGEGAQVYIWEDCLFSDNSECFINSPLKEATIETNLPKFMVFCEMPDVSCENNGAVVSSSNVTIRLNGEEYPLSSAEYYLDESSGEIVEYDGQDASVHNVAMWMENNSSVFMHIAIK